jgi:hypothetical protein
MTDPWKKLEPVFLMLAVGFSRFALRSHKLYDLDSVNFALGMQRFCPRVHQPHPPGYFLYICLARLVDLFVHDANLALVLVSIAASSATIAVIYKLGVDWFGRMEARFASTVFLFSPLGWFHGIVALTYSVEAFFSGLLALLCWRLNLGNLSMILPAAVTLGISAGIRPSSLVFLGPLYLYSLRKLSPGQKLLSAAVLMGTVAAWFLPMILLSGGLSAYFEALATLWRAVPSKGTIFNSSPANTIARAFVILFIGLLMCGGSSFIVLDAFRRKISVDAEKIRFTLVWITPALSFYTFIFLKFVNSGYLLLLLPPISIWVGYWVAEWYRDNASRALYKLPLIAVCITINTLCFLVSPLYCSYRSVRQLEAQLQDVTAALPLAASPEDTVVIGFDSHFLGYRHAGYYLPGYLTIEYPEVHYPDGSRVFSLEHRKTNLTDELPWRGYKRFVLFPLPTGDPGYVAYMNEVERLLPRRSLEMRHIGNCDFVSGPITLLPLLFPATTQVSKSAVYPLLHSGGRDMYTNVNTSSLEHSRNQVSR